ncbi:hypothetical protein BDZ89DRAFT_508001 [Hymenopellis radicata]|nr:hypothetical protein BDZ89DRAFT_508001 [Hymenopellis radicata]
MSTRRPLVRGIIVVSSLFSYYSYTAGAPVGPPTTTSGGFVPTSLDGQALRCMNDGATGSQCTTVASSRPGTEMSRHSRLEVSSVFGRCLPLTGVGATIRRQLSSRTSSIIHKASFLLPRLPSYVYLLF